MAFFETTWYTNAGDQSTTGYYAVAKRPQNAAVAAGQLVRQFTAPAVGSERVFVCIVAGTTANTTDATWVTSRAAKTTDGTATWMECTGVAAVNGDAVNTVNWTQAKVVGSANAGTIIKRNNGASYQICTTTMTLGSSEPAFSDTAGVTTVEGSGVWTSLGPVTNFTGGQAPHARIPNACTLNWFAAGNTVYVGDNHAESQATALTIGPAGSGSTVGKILCHNHSGSYPPTAGNLTTGATISTTGAVNFTILPSAVGAFYFYGLTFKGGVGQSANVGVTINDGNGSLCYFDNCSFATATTGSGGTIQVGGTQVGITTFNNTTVQFANVGQQVLAHAGSGQFIWQNTGPVLASGSTVPNSLLVGSGGTQSAIVLEALDLSQITGNLISVGVNGYGTVLIKDCKLNASATLSGTPLVYGMTVQNVRSDSAAAAYKSARYVYEGTETTETSITRVGGASDPTGQAQSRKIVTTANSQWLRPFKAEPYAIWNPTTGANVTVTVCGTVNAGALPNNDDIWLEVEYLGDGPVATTLNGTAVNATLSGGNLTATHSNTTTNSGARSTISKTAGKFYFEATFNTTPTNGDCVGIMQNASAFSDPVTSGVNCSCAYGAGLTYSNDVSTVVTLGAFAAGHVLSVAIDFDNAKCWFRRDGGTWNLGIASGDPVAGTGSSPIKTPSVGYVPFVGFTTGGSGNNVTMNFGATAFAYTPPVGFGNWIYAGSPLGTIVTTTKANVLAANAAVASDGSTWNGMPVNATLDGPTTTTMSNGNLTTQHGTATNNYVTSTAFLVSGKYYFETTIQGTLSANYYAGVVLQGDVPPSGNISGVQFGAALHIYSNLVDTGKLLPGSVAVNDVYGSAIDLTNRLAWFRKNGGNWNNDGTANPATGVGGVVISAGAFAPFASFANTSSSAAQMTFNFGQSTFVNAAPSGFGNWAIGWSPFKLTTTLSAPQPGMAGYLHARVRAAKPSTTFYIDPMVVLS